MSMLAKLLVALLWVPMPAVWSGSPAYAGSCTESSTAEAGVGSGEFMVSGASQDCVSEVDTVQGGAVLEVTDPACSLGGSVSCTAGQSCEGTGQLHETQLVFPDGHTEPGPQVCVGGEQAPAKQLTAERVLQAFREVPLPTPSLGTSPPDGTTLVNVPTIFYTRAEPFGRDVRVLGRRVHLEIAPVSYEWRVGQGGDFETTSPGSPYQRGVTPQSDPDAYVTWTYDSASSEAASVRVVWGATWSLGGKSMGRVPGTVEMLSSTATVRVREAQPVLTATLRD